ncbi:MAG: CHAD domain-containing protein [Planctomycetota bacterium]|jgi:CHAD domain-containing protein
MSKLDKAPDGKWIEGVSPQDSVSQAARRVLRARLATVWHWLPLAAERSEEDVEYVHRLRVATRRATAALRMFREFAAGARYRAVKQHLRRIRRAANDARDLDVMGERFARLAVGNGDGPSGTILGRIGVSRQRAQDPLAALFRQLSKERFDRQIDALIEDVRFQPSRKREPKFGREARRYLRRAVKKFLKASRGDLADPMALHELRIRGKELRYTMEIVAGAFAEAFRGVLYPRIEELQDHLGTINDHFTAQRRFRDWSAASESRKEKAYFERLVSAEQKAFSKGRKAFLTQWIPKRMSKLKRWLQAYCAKRATA